jgi:hypothetical protein
MTTKYAKVLRKDMNHFGFQYRFGLNILEGELNTDKSMPVGKGGFYYCNIENVGGNIYRGDFLCVVQIPEDAVVIANLLDYVTRDEYFRTDKIILTKEIYNFYSDEDVKKLTDMIPNLKGYLNDSCFLKNGRTIIQ